MCCELPEPSTDTRRSLHPLGLLRHLRRSQRHLRRQMPRQLLRSNLHSEMLNILPHSHPPILQRQLHRQQPLHPDLPRPRLLRRHLRRHLHLDLPGLHLRRPQPRQPLVHGDLQLGLRVCLWDEEAVRGDVSGRDVGLDEFVDLCDDAGGMWKFVC